MKREPEAHEPTPEWTGRLIVLLVPPIEDALVKLHESQANVYLPALADVVSALVPAEQLPPGFNAWRGAVAPGAGGTRGRRDSSRARLQAVAPSVVRPLIELGAFLQANPRILPGDTVAVASSSLAHKVVALEWAARQSLLPPVASLLAFYYVDARALKLSSDAAEEFSNRLRALSAIESVYPEPVLENAAWKVTMDDLDQGYIKGGQNGPNAFRGINAATPSVWGQVDGSPIGFVDFERGWNLNHPELPVATLPQPLHNVAASGESEREHGTSVLSVVLAKHNENLAVGIAPGATFVGVVSPIQKPGAVDEADKADVVSALLAARQFMNPGDVLLIEQQLKVPGAEKYPMEAVRPYLDAIRLLVASGIVVIEAGGNGGHNLDDPLPAALGSVPTFSLNPNSPNDDFLDSGAVLVGSCREGVVDDRGPHSPHHKPTSETPRGARVDCSAWGENVEVVRTKTAANSNKTDFFNGTSAAAAIIAGAALLVQALSVKKRGVALMPLQVRELLSDRSLGTPIVKGRKVVGTMPDVSQIAAQLDHMPDIFVGDVTQDDGERAGPLRCDSHDIVVRAQPIAGVARQLGPGSEFAEAPPPSDPVNASGTNFVYLRVRNRGKSAADNLTLHLFWAEAGVMMPPNRWHYIAASAATDIAERNGSKRAAALAIPPRITWDASSAAPALPGDPSRIALISVATHVMDPAPLYALPTSDSSIPATFTPNERLDFFNAYLQLLRSNNVGMINRHVVANLVTDAGGKRSGDLAFRLFGAAGLSVLFDLELTTETPGIAKVAMVLPAPLYALVAPQLAAVGQSAALDARGLHFPAAGSLVIPGVALPADADFGCAVHVTDAGPGAGVWNIAQIVQGTVVGRLTLALPG